MCVFKKDVSIIPVCGNVETQGPTLGTCYSNVTSSHDSSSSTIQTNECDLGAMTANIQFSNCSVLKSSIQGYIPRVSKLQCNALHRLGSLLSNAEAQSLRLFSEDEHNKILNDLAWTLA